MPGWPSSGQILLAWDYLSPNFDHLPTLQTGIKRNSHVNNFLMDFCVLLIAAINLAKLKLFRHYYVMVSKTPAHMHVGNLEAVQSF